jgi:hypothetical protein
LEQAHVHAWNTFRDHLILEYEVPKYDGGLTTPNAYVPLAEATRPDKVTFLMESFGLAARQALVRTGDLRGVHALAWSRVRPRDGLRRRLSPSQGGMGVEPIGEHDAVNLRDQGRAGHRRKAAGWDRHRLRVCGGWSISRHCCTFAGEAVGNRAAD